jgi:hypothetical protein
VNKAQNRLGGVFLPKHCEGNGAEGNPYETPLSGWLERDIRRSRSVASGGGGVDQSLIDFRLPADPLGAEWVATILLREERASGCFTQPAQNRCKTRHEKGNVTRMLGCRSRN